MIIILKLIGILFRKYKRALYFALFFKRMRLSLRGLLSFFKYLGFYTGVLALLLFINLTITAWGWYEWFKLGLPEPTPQAMSAMPESTRIFDRNGELLYEVHGDVKRRFVPLSEIPRFVQEATIAIEDKNFFSHPGFDAAAILRAFYVNLKNQGISQGASTITQQLARTLFLDQDRVYTRKIKELILAMEIERRYSKDQILEMYLNSVPYGSVAYGVSAASEIYFNKPVSSLGLKEAAYLAALPKAPSDYSPFGGNLPALEKRAEKVLAAMVENRFLALEQADYILGTGVPAFVKAPATIKAPHFVFFVLENLESQYGKEAVREGGWDVYTTLDLRFQKEAEKIVEKIGRINEEKYRAGNAALAALIPESGEIVAMVGSRDYFQEGFGAFNAAISPRQPGSSFKPYVYAAALENGLTPDTYLFDSRTDFASYNYGVEYIPRNYNGRYYGRVSVRQALAGSLNIPAVKVLVGTGIGKTIDLAEKLGISTLSERARFGPSLALGGGELKLLEHTYAFGIFGNNGKKAPLIALKKIVSREGKIFYQAPDRPEYEQAIDPFVAYSINDILSDSKARQYIFGPGNRLEIPGYAVAAKTGTTQDYHDAWTLGYTPGLAVGVWAGNNDNSPMAEGANGYVVAAPIWREFMDFALKIVPKKDFLKPDKTIQKPELKVVEESIIPAQEKNTLDEMETVQNRMPISYEPVLKEKQDNARILIVRSPIDPALINLDKKNQAGLEPDDFWAKGILLSPKNSLISGQSLDTAPQRLINVPNWQFQNCLRAWVCSANEGPDSSKQQFFYSDYQ